jgi:hypothetical protein
VVEDEVATNASALSHAVPEPAPIGEMWEESIRGEPLPAQLSGLPGADQLRLLLSGRVAPPPISHLVGMRLTEIGVGTTTFPPTTWRPSLRGGFAA